MRARDQPRAGQNINGWHHVLLFIKGTHAAAAGPHTSFTLSLPFRKPPAPIARGTTGRFSQGLRLGKAEGRTMLFGKLHCVCVKAKEHDQDTVTSTISSFFPKAFSYEYIRKSMRINIFGNFNKNYQTIISIFKYKSQIYILHNYYCSYEYIRKSMYIII